MIRKIVDARFGEGELGPAVFRQMVRPTVRGLGRYAVQYARRNRADPNLGRR